MRALILGIVLLLLLGCGDDSARVLFNDSVAALRAGDLVKAEVSAERAAARRPEILPLRDFVLGSSSFTRCEREEIKIYGPRGGSAAIDAALEHATRARDFWESAAASKDDWPEARRNVERALLKIAILRKLKEEAETKPQNRPQPKPRPVGAASDDAPTGRGTDRRPTPRVDPQVAELPPDQVARVLERLNEKEREKLRVRRAEQQAQRAQVEKDW